MIEELLAKAKFRCEQEIDRICKDHPEHDILPENAPCDMCILIVEVKLLQMDLKTALGRHP